MLMTYHINTMNTSKLSQEIPSTRAVVVLTLGIRANCYETKEQLKSCIKQGKLPIPADIL